MGMYDTITGLKVYCPRCGELLPSDFQTKSLQCLLNTYKIGDKVDTEYTGDPRYDWIEVHTACDNCRVGHYAYLVSVRVSVEDGVLTGELI